MTWLQDTELDAQLKTLLEAGRAEAPTRPQLHALRRSVARAVMLPWILGGVTAFAASVIATAALISPVEDVAHAEHKAGAAKVSASPSETREPAPLRQPAPNETDAPTEQTQAEPETVVERAPQRDAQRPSELVLLSRAQRSLDHAPTRALRVLDRHRRIHPEGELAQEREALRIRALLRLDRRAEADAALARFRARWPSSPHENRLRILVE